MERNDLLHHCRYYKGEKENPHPEGNEALFWDYERIWVDAMMKDSDLLPEYIEEYIGIGLRNFEKADDTPTSLKALLFNRFCHWNSGSMIDCLEPFKEFYLKDYIKGKAAN